MYDVTDQCITQVREFVQQFPRAHADIARLLNRNRIFVDRTKGIGVLTRDQALDLIEQSDAVLESSVRRRGARENPGRFRSGSWRDLV